MLYLFTTLAVELLEASTREAYLMSKNVLERRNIICAFTGHDHWRCNQAEVVHTSWKKRDETGLSLYQAAEFDTRDCIL